ncbi:cation:proton antiporter [Desulfosediminicola flagellatus]|uniref:cation:proton antiporter n=1 Tax=Desulfosediminicola flagellatus TaxID=2569541 RepID=UPI0010ABDF20|nr:cation:proton antiporter [Desulfosediminicola flagellatus]
MEQHTGFLILLAVVLALFFGAILRHILKKIAIPYTVSLLVIGLGLGLLKRGGMFDDTLYMLGESIELVAAIDPHLIMFLFLPTLIFESAFAMEGHLFRRAFTQIAILAVPGLILCTLLTAFLIKAFFPWDWSWPAALLFGALISATDPVAVVALLKELSSRKRLETLIEGESLLNDGTAIVFFALFYGFVAGDQQANFDAGIIPLIGWNFVVKVSLGVLTGLFFGMLAIVFIGRVFKDAMIEITISIVVAYLTFIVAESLLHVSGVVAVVTLALLLASVGKTRISPEIEGFLHHFWEMMAYIANTLIFLLVGVIIALRVQLDSPASWGALFILFIGIMIIRAVSISMFLPLLQRIGLGITREKSIVLIWGGLRGAVALALALVVAQDRRIPSELGDQILFLTAGIVVLTLLINGTSMQLVLKWVGLDKLPPAKQSTVDKARVHIQREMDELLPTLKENGFFQGADWDQVEQNIGLVAAGTHDFSEEKSASPQELECEFKRRILEAERSNYWWQWGKGLLGGTGTNILIDAVEKALDGQPTITPRPMLQKLWKMPMIAQLLGKIPFAKDFAVSVSFDRLALGYDVARGFIYAQDASLERIPQLAPDDTSAERVRKEILKNKRDTYERIEQLRAAFPEVVVAIETRAASRSLLNRQRSVIDKLIGNGLLDTAEADRMLEEVNKQQQRLRQTPTRIETLSPEALLRQESWLKSVKPETRDRLLSAMEVRFHAAGDVLLHFSESGMSLVVIVRGAVAVSRKNAKRQIVDDILGPGAVLGITAILSGDRGETVRAESPVEALWFNAVTIQELMSLDDVFAHNMRELTGA